MLTYEYACSGCGHEWEQEQSIVEPPIEVCPACKNKTAKRLVSSGNFILKGGGWYADLYSGSSNKSGSASSSSSSKSYSATPSTSSSSTSSAPAKPAPSTPPSSTT